MVDRSSMHRSVSILLLALGMCLAASGPSVFAANTSPMTRAARLTFIQGNVTVAGPGNAESVPAQLNLPLLSGVQLTTGSDGQAEVEFEDGSIIRLTPSSALSLKSLTVQPDGVFLSNLSLLRGLAYCELRATSQYRYTLGVGGDLMSPIENTTVRVNFDESPAIFSVLDGTALIERQSATNNEATQTGYQTQVRAGETFRADRTDLNRYFLTEQIAEDSWDQWNENRDQAASSGDAASTAVRNDYAGAQGYGWSDLDANGSWYDVPGQGQVWQPQVALDDASFDPYGNGAWVFYANTGYVWASSYPWGWTPYRCGNWSYYNSFGWGWAPGSGCGGYGWGFAGGGRPVNIVLGPAGYRPTRIPLRTGPGRLQPILPVQVKAWQRHGSPDGDRNESRRETQPRRIAGLAIVPIKPVNNILAAEDNHVSSALRRDYPIDAVTRAPVLGLASTSPTLIHTNSNLRSYPSHPVSADNPAENRQPQLPYTPDRARPNPASGAYRPAPQAGPAPPYSQGQRSVQQNAPTEYHSPQTSSQPASMYPAPTHQTSTPPPPSPFSHPMHSAPPSLPPQAAHPAQSAPPPSLPAVSHPAQSAPPPSPPPAASHPQTSPTGRSAPR